MVNRMSSTMRIAFFIVAVVLVCVARTNGNDNKKKNGIILKMQNGESHYFDKVIIATLPHQALTLLDDPTENELNCLSIWKAHKIKIG